jgi:hypothetical protein
MKCASRRLFQNLVGQALQALTPAFGHADVQERIVDGDNFVLPESQANGTIFVGAKSMPTEAFG